MMPKQLSFQARLARVMSDGRLSVADLAVWFGRPYQTVRFWRYPIKKAGASEPWGVYRDDAYRRLAELETIVKYAPHRLPDDVSPPERRLHMKVMRREYDRTLSKAHSAA